MYVVTCANFKGGSGKSTTAGMLAHAFQHLGWRVGVVDADPNQASLKAWSKLANELEPGSWTIPVWALPKVSQLRDVTGYVDPKRFDVLVVDTPPLLLQRAITDAALRFTDYLVVPLKPSFSEFEALGQIWPVMRETGIADDEYALLFNAAKGRTALRTYRGQAEEAGRNVLDIVVPDLERYRQIMQGGVTMTSSDYFYLAAEKILARTGWELAA